MVVAIDCANDKCRERREERERDREMDICLKYQLCAARL